VRTLLEQGHIGYSGSIVMRIFWPQVGHKIRHTLKEDQGKMGSYKNSAEMLFSRATRVVLSEDRPCRLVLSCGLKLSGGGIKSVHP